MPTYHLLVVIPGNDKIKTVTLTADSPYQAVMRALKTKQLPHPYLDQETFWRSLPHLREKIMIVTGDGPPLDFVELPETRVTRARDLWDHLQILEDFHTAATQLWKSRVAIDSKFHHIVSDAASKCITDAIDAAAKAANDAGAALVTEGVIDRQDALFQDDVTRMLKPKPPARAPRQIVLPPATLPSR